MAPKDSAADGAHHQDFHEIKLPVQTVPTSHNVHENNNNVPIQPLKHLGSKVQRNNIAKKIIPDLRDDAVATSKFITALNLIPKSNVVQIRNSRNLLSPSMKQRLELKKGRVARYFRDNPVPLCSAAGQKILRNTAAGQCAEPEPSVKKYESFCGTHRTDRTCVTAKSMRTQPWRQVNLRRLKQAAGKYVHKYSSGKKERVERLSEIVIGLNKKSFAALNECQGFDLKVHRMTDEEIVLKMSEVEKAPQVRTDQQEKAAGLEPTHWTSSEPVASTSNGVETLAAPAVSLFNFMLDPCLAKKFLKRTGKRSQ